MEPCQWLPEHVSVRGAPGRGEPDVGPAQVFYSHCQKEDINVTLDTLTMFPSSGIISPAMLPIHLHIWIDYCSIRQCLPNEFKPEEIASIDRAHRPDDH